MSSSNDQPAVETENVGTVSDAGGRTYLVSGMTCDHCVMSVTEEIEQVHGVTGVDVDLASGRVTVRGEGFSDDAIRKAVDEAGYVLAGQAGAADSGAAGQTQPHRL
jgi:copper chaperone